VKINEDFYYIPPVVYPRPTAPKPQAADSDRISSERDVLRREAFAALMKKRGSSAPFLSGTIIFTLLTALVITVTASSPVYALFSVPNTFICAGLWIVFAQCGSKRGFKTTGLVYIKAVFLLYTSLLLFVTFTVSTSLFFDIFISVFRLIGRGLILRDFAIFAATLAALIHGISVITAISALTSRNLPTKISLFMPVMSFIAAAAYSAVMAVTLPRGFNMAAAVLNAAASVILTVSFLKFRKDYKKI